MARNFRSFSAEEIFEILAADQAGTLLKDLLVKYDLSPSTLRTFRKNFSEHSLDQIQEAVRSWNKYKKIFAAIFEEKFATAERRPVDLTFTTGDIARWQKELKLEGGNPYDLKYNAKGRGALPPEVQATAPAGQEWRIKSVGTGQYVFRLAGTGTGIFEVDPHAVTVKIPDSLPTMVERYARDDEQALLARIRYNDLVNIFVGLNTYSLQSHWKTSIKGTGSVEVDEVYVGLDRNGTHFVIPVEAKGREKSEKLTADQLITNYRACINAFPDIEVISLAAKVIDDYKIAMFRFDVDVDTETVEKVFERHYILASNVPSTESPRPVLFDSDISENAKLPLDDSQVD